MLASQDTELVYGLYTLNKWQTVKVNLMEWWVVNQRDGSLENLARTGDGMGFGNKSMSIILLTI